MSNLQDVKIKINQALQLFLKWNNRLESAF